MATEMKVGLLTVQNVRRDLSPFKIICAWPQFSNDVSAQSNDSILHCVDDLPNVQFVSIVFDGLAYETKFIHTYLISFMNGTFQTVAMTDCNHAAKNICSQLVISNVGSSTTNYAIIWNDRTYLFI